MPIVTGGQHFVKQIFAIGIVMVIFLIGLEIAYYFEKVDLEIRDDIESKLDPLVATIFSVIAVLPIVTERNFSAMVIYILTPIFGVLIVYILIELRSIDSDDIYKAIERIKTYYMILAVVSVVGIFLELIGM